MSELSGARPAPGRSYHRHELIAKRLKARTGEWAWIVYSSGKGALKAAGCIALGYWEAYAPAGDFEADHRKVDGQWRVYLRYLGDGPDGSA